MKNRLSHCCWNALSGNVFAADFPVKLRPSDGACPLGSVPDSNGGRNFFAQSLQAYQHHKCVDGPCSLLKGKKAAAPFSISTERIRFSHPMFNSAIMVRSGAAHLQIRHHRLEGEREYSVEWDPIILGGSAGPSNRVGAGIVERPQI
jgi:hypothetical protein